MSHGTIILNTKEARVTAHKWIDLAPDNATVDVKLNKRSIPQNDLLHAVLSELASQMLWHGMKLSVPDWKLFFLDALKREIRIVPNIDGTGFVNLGRSTAKLTKDECTALIEVVYAFGIRHGVKFRNDRQEIAA